LLLQTFNTTILVEVILVEGQEMRHWSQKSAASDQSLTAA